MEILAHFIQIESKQIKTSTQLCFITRRFSFVCSLMSVRSTRMLVFVWWNWRLSVRVFSQVSPSKDVAASLRPAAAVFAPAARSVLCFALWAERLLGLFPGQHGEHWEDGNDERCGRRFCHGPNPPSRRARVPLWLPLPAEGRPVLRPGLVRVHGREAEDLAWPKGLSPPLLCKPGDGLLLWGNAGVFWQGEESLWGILCSRLCLRATWCEKKWN